MSTCRGTVGHRGEAWVGQTAALGAACSSTPIPYGKAREAWDMLFQNIGRCNPTGSYFLAQPESKQSDVESRFTWALPLDRPPGRTQDQRQKQKSCPSTTSVFLPFMLTGPLNLVK